MGGGHRLVTHGPATAHTLQQTTRLSHRRNLGGPGGRDRGGRDDTAPAPDQRWCGDITYIKSWDGWVYLATVIDLHSRRVVGWALADHMRTELVTEALEMALAQRKPKGKVIFHSDYAEDWDTLPTR